MADTTITTDSNNLAKVSDGRYVNPNYATPEALKGIAQNQNTAITPDALSPVVPLSIPTPNPASTAASGVNAATESKFNSLQKELQDIQSSAKETVTTDKKSFLESLGLKSKAVEDKAAAYQTPEFLQKKEASDTAYKQLVASRQAQDAEIKAIKDQSMLTDVQKSQKFNEISDRYAFKNAQLSLSYDIATKDYQSAQEQIDTIAKLKMDAAQPYVDYYSQILKSDEAALSEADKNALSLKLDEFKNAQTNATAVGDVLKTAVANGVQLSQQDVEKINSSATPAEAYAYLASKGISLQNPLDNKLKQAQLDKLNADIRKTNAEIAGLNPTVTNPEAGKYGTALSTILGSSKFTAIQRKDVIDAINAGQDPFSVVKNQAKNIMGQTEATKVTETEKARDALVTLGDQLNAFYAAGGKTNIFEGNFEKVINKLGEVRDPNLVNLATQIEGTLQVYRNAISGTAYSEQEGRAIQSIFPGINKSQELNAAILRGRDITFGSVIDSAYRSALGSTYDDLKKVQASGGSTGGTAGGATVKVNGSDWVVGQLYQDAKGNKGTFDSTGKWIPQ